MASMSDVIVIQETLGARMFAATFDRFPVRERLPGGIAPHPDRPSLPEILGRMGFEVGEPIVDDVYPDRPPLFVRVTPPAGWSIRQEADPYFTRVLDDLGRERAMISFKASHHDRHAHAVIHPRYGISLMRVDAAGDRAEDRATATHERWAVVDRSDGGVVHAEKTLPSDGFDAGGTDGAAHMDRWHWAREACKDWIATNHPGTDPSEHWEAAASPTP